MATFVILLGALLTVGGAYASDPGSPVPVGFVLTAVVPICGLALSSAAGGPIRYGRPVTLALILSASALALHPGFSLGNPWISFLRCLVLFATLACVARGVVACLTALGVSRPLSVALWVLSWSLVVAAPFFLVSLMRDWFPGWQEDRSAQWVVRIHPLGALCDGLGGVDGFRHDRLYERAEIGARYAYRLPDVWIYSAVCAAIHLLGCLASKSNRVSKHDTTSDTERSPA